MKDDKKAMFKIGFTKSFKFSKGEEVLVVGETDSCYIIERHGIEHEIIKNQLELIQSNQEDK